MKFSERLLALGFGTYAEYLASEHWAGFRRQYKSAGLRMTCLVCSGKPIQLHHRTYVRLGRERTDDVIPVCRAHHSAIHDWLKASGRKFVEFTHEAVAALGGECPAPPCRAKGVGKAIGLPKRDEKRAKRKAEKKAARLERRRLAAAVVFEKPTPEIAELVAQAASYSLSDKQKLVVARLAKDADAKQLRGFLKCIRDTREARNKSKAKRKQNRVTSVKRSREQEQAHAVAKRKAAVALSAFRKLKGADRVNALNDAVKRAGETTNSP